MHVHYTSVQYDTVQEGSPTLHVPYRLWDGPGNRRRQAENSSRIFLVFWLGVSLTRGPAADPGLLNISFILVQSYAARSLVPTGIPATLQTDGRCAARLELLIETTPPSSPVQPCVFPSERNCGPWGTCLDNKLQALAYLGTRTAGPDWVCVPEQTDEQRTDAARSIQRYRTLGCAREKRENGGRDSLQYTHYTGVV